MDNLNDMAALHSAGAIIRHNSLFDSLPTYQNKALLTTEFTRKWVIPYYMEITSWVDHQWISSMEAIKNEITIEVCQSLLGDFNWRPRLVGSYFAAVKGYEELTDIIGVHLLKSQVCCVGHIHALTLAFFNNEKCGQYLDKYLSYYLTRPDLYYDQEFVMEALLYLDHKNGTNIFENHLKNWEEFEEERKRLQEKSAIYAAKLLEETSGKAAAENYLQSAANTKDEESESFSFTFYQEQIQILTNLRKSK